MVPLILGNPNIRGYAGHMYGVLVADLRCQATDSICVFLALPFKEFRLWLHRYIPSPTPQCHVCIPLLCQPAVPGSCFFLQKPRTLSATD